MLCDLAEEPIATPFVPIATAASANLVDAGSAAITSVIIPDCIASAAKILATTIFFLPVLFFAISDTTM